MIQFMTRVVLNDMRADDLTTRWLLWVGTPHELQMTHEVWQSAPPSFSLVDQMMATLYGSRT